MTITSVGYAGQITDANWRRVATATIGSLYGVDDYASWRVTPGTGDRAVDIAPGGGFGLGVRDESDTVVTKTMSPVPSGVRWDLVVAHRNWETKTTTFEVIPGTSSMVLPDRQVGFGTVNDQPIALVQSAAGQSAVQKIIDLRCIPGDGGVVAFDALVRSYLDRVGTQVRINGTLWSRIIDALGTPAWLEGDSRMYGHAGMVGAGGGNYLPIPAPGKTLPLTVPTPALDLSGGVTAAENGLQVPVSGRYRITLGFYFTGTTDPVCVGVLRVNGVIDFSRGMPKVVGVDEARTYVIQKTLAAGDILTITAQGAYAWGKTGYDGMYLEVEKI